LKSANYRYPNFTSASQSRLSYRQQVALGKKSQRKRHCQPTLGYSSFIRSFGNALQFDWHCAHSFVILGHVRHLLFRIFEQLWFIDMFVPWTYCNQKCQVL